MVSKDSMSTIELFPVEVVERILYFANGAAFALQGRVCKKWKNAQANLERISNHWRKCSSAEIELQIIEELINSNQQNADEVDLDNKQLWKSLYIKWWRTRNIHSRDTVRKKISFHAAEEYVRVAKITGNLLVTGHRSGSVAVVDYHGKNIVIAENHLEPITDIALLDVAGKGRYNIFPSDNPLSYSAHHHVISIAKDSILKVFPLRPAHMNKQPNCVYEVKISDGPLEQVRVCRDTVVISSQLREVIIWKIQVTEKESVPLDKPLYLHPLKIVYCPDFTRLESRWNGWITVWGTRVSCLCSQTGYLSSLDFRERLAYEHPNEPWDWEFQRPLSMKDITSHRHTYVLERGFIFRENLMFVSLSSKKILYSDDGLNFNLLPICEDLPAKLMTMCLWGSFVAFGFDSGHVLVYNCPSSTSLGVLHLRSPVWNEAVSYDPIVAIDMRDDGSGPVLVACTKTEVHIINWKHPNIAEENTMQ